MLFQTPHFSYLRCKTILFCVALFCIAAPLLAEEPKKEASPTAQKPKKPKIKLSVPLIDAILKNRMRQKMFAAFAHKRLVLPNMVWQKANAMHKIINEKHYARWLNQNIRAYQTDNPQQFIEKHVALLRKRLPKRYKVQLINNSISKLHEDTEIFQITAFQMSRWIEKNNPKRLKEFRVFEEKKKQTAAKLVNFLKSLLRKV
ncbi:MAG: hypothetical protein V6Z78_02000 [Holosporaceae bacterium]